jgi:hypothetical protein
MRGRVTTLQAKVLLVFLGVMSVNIASAQRVLSQKMTKEAALGDAAAARASIARFDRVLKGLIQGDAASEELSAQSLIMRATASGLAALLGVAMAGVGHAESISVEVS